MERYMSPLQKLKEKIEQWKLKYNKLQEENSRLQADLDAVAQNKDSSQIIALKRELEEKDKEIEKIITQVEALLL